MSGSAWPPSGPTTMLTVIPAYAYEQFADDPNVVAFFDAYNQIAQSYLNWFNNTPLGVYTSPAISGPLLDWIAEGLYGISRPALPYGILQSIGPLNTWEMNSITLNTIQVTGVINYFSTTDDVFKRIITWFFFKGDGQIFSVEWLKRRCMRFLTGFNGVSNNIDQTYQIGVTFGVDNEVTITVTLTSTGSITLANAQIFQAAIQSNAVCLPFQYAFNVVIVNNLMATGLTDVSNVLNVTILTGWPTSATGLAAGAVWENSGVVRVVAGVTPNPYAAPLVFGVVTSVLLLSIGGGNLPTSNPGVGSGQLWNNSGTVNVA